jgi:hypothetical protein
MNEALNSSETSVLTRTTWRNIPEDIILHSHCREDLKSYIVLMLSFQVPNLINDREPRIVMCFERHVSEGPFPEQPVRNYMTTCL